MNEERFSFERLESKLAVYVPSTPVLGSRRSTRWSFLVALPSAAIGMLASYVFDGKVALIVALIALAVELIAVGTLVVNTI